jgi:hypothetical protein
MKKPHATTESGKPTKRESTDEHQVKREDMGARREQWKRHHRSRKPCRKAIYIYILFFTQSRSQISHPGQRPGTSRKQRPILVDSGGRSKQFPDRQWRLIQAKTTAASSRQSGDRAGTERIPERAETERDRVPRLQPIASGGPIRAEEAEAGLRPIQKGGSRAGDRRPPRDGAEDGRPPGRPTQ